MNTAVRDAAQQLEAALKLVPGHDRKPVEVVRDPGATLHPPTLVLGPPSLIWETGCAEPTSARFIVFAVVDSNEYAVERLWVFVAETAGAIDTHTDAVVVRADPSAYPNGGVELPAYELQVEVAL